MVNTIDDVFGHIVDEDATAAQALEIGKSVLELGRNVQDKYTRLFIPRLPDFDQLRTELGILAGEQGKAAQSFLQKVQSNYFSDSDGGHSKTLDSAMVYTLSNMSSESIRQLPDQFRIDLLHMMLEKTQESPAFQEQALRLATGYSADELKDIAPAAVKLQYGVSFSRPLALYQLEKEKEISIKEKEFLTKNPEISALVEKWKINSNSLTGEEKLKVLDAYQSIHADVFGYDVVPIRTTHIPGGVVGQAFDVVRKDGGHGLILLDEKGLNGASFGTARNLLLHESDHLAQSNWMRNLHDMPDDDPRKDYLRRYIAFSGVAPNDEKANSLSGGMGFVQFIVYAQLPNELHAYLFHSPDRQGGAPYDFEKLEADPAYRPNCAPILCLN